jgi:pilus assembly protein CpaC
MKRLIAALAAGLGLALAVAPAVSAQTLDGAPPPGTSTLHIDLKGDATQSLSLPRGKSAIIELPVDVRDLHVTDPKIADVALPYARRIYVMGVGSGQTDAIFFDGAGRRILSLNIRVELDLGGLSQTISRVAPTARVQAEAINDRVILTGQVANIGDSDRVVRVAASYTTKPENVLNMMTIMGKDQVLLKVRIVEMQRNVLKQFGVNTSALINQIGGPQYLFSSTASFAVNGGVQGGLKSGYTLDTTQQPMLTIPCANGVSGDCKAIIRGPQDAANWNTATQGTTVGSNNLNKAEGTLNAFERVGLVRVLAEPNLTAVSGEGARFLAGGEFPVPVSVDSAGQVSVSYKPFGVGLAFTPVVLSDGRISLKISTEVSDVSPNGAYTIGGGNGRPAITIPAVVVRRAETSVEMGSGSQMMIAGLLREDVRQNIDGIPGLKDLAVLGTLFRSRDYLNGESELVVIVTPYIVNPTNPGAMQTPADGLRIATDAETILMGKLNHAYKVTPPAGRTYQGPYGHVID